MCREPNRRWLDSVPYNDPVPASQDDTLKAKRSSSRKSGSHKGSSHKRGKSISGNRKSRTLRSRHVWEAVRLLVALFAIFALAAPAALSAPAYSQPKELLVSAAVSLKESFVQLAREFEKTHQGVKVSLNFGGSGELAQQISRGAPVDVFASAGWKQIKQLEAKTFLLSASIKAFAGNHLVVVVPEGNPDITALEKLSSVKSLAIGNPETVPAGQYAAQALSKARVYEDLSSSHRLVLTENIRQTLAYVESGDVDAGIVYSTDARPSNKVKVTFLVPENYSEPIVYAIAVVKDSKRAALAQEFIRLVCGKSGQDILRTNGFSAAAK